MLQKKQQEKELKQALQKMILEASLKNMRLKKGANLSGIDTSRGMEGMLSKIPELFEQLPNYSQMKSVLGMQDLTQKMENQRKLRVMGGQEEPSPEEITQFTPQLQKPILGMGGRATGGEVILPKDASFTDGQMLSPTGGRIGEYMPGYEPKPVGNFPVAPEEVAGALRQKFAGGISKEELQRKALGLPRFSGRATQNQLVTLATKLAQAENPLATEQEIKAKIPTAQKMLEGNVFSGQTLGTSTEEFTDEQEKLIQDNMDAYPDKTEDEIIEALKEQGYL
jgi:hypothetical protein